MKIVIIGFVCFLLHIQNIMAQSRISVYGGWTASKIRAIYDKNTYKPGPLAGDSFINLPFWHTIYLGGEFEYDYKKLRLSSGFGFMAVGSSNIPGFPGYPWVTAYYTFPLLGGYNLKLDKGWDIIFEGGVEIGIQLGGGTIRTGGGARWGNVNLVAGVETEWKNFRLGVRGHLGVTNFRRIYDILYKHTAITTYIGYTLWDHKKCKARRLAKKQERLLN